MKKLPIGISTFEKIRSDDYIYIDKTKEALELIENGAYYFLSRPRRFGKSLFLDTLKEIFEGNKELFKGLYIYDKYDFTPHPVIKISFSGGIRDQKSLNRYLFLSLKENQKRLQIECEEDEYPDICFRELIVKAYEKYNKKVVVLVDEYDKPILDNINKLDIAYEIREGLKDFYTKIKDSDEYLQFAFLTGVSKFSKVSIFSGLNNLEDITLHTRYSTICGYTQRDIETSFKELLEGVDLEKLKEWYNGYNFLGERVYNPFDILLFISNNFIYKNYWFSTGTPSFLIKLLKEGNYFIPSLENLVAGETLIDSFDIERLKLEPLLFQSGYLTIDKAEERSFGGYRYYLKPPNKEVQISFNDILIDFLTKDDEYEIRKDDIYLSLEKTDMESFKETLISLYASIPYNTYVKNNISSYEGYYASVFYVYIASLGVKIIAEDVTNRGRIDFTVFIKDKIYIFEFKVTNEDPLSQIKKKKYYEKYLNENKEIILVGIKFDEEEKNIKELVWERV
ncbi:MAG: AAA family ATPase [Epsilonproteobacteria bacterium]|nr:AAA family ATPase [Campylobacterota bacterium]